MRMHRSILDRMRLVVLVCQLCLILKTEAQNTPTQCVTSNTNRPPENSDINVVCGTEWMELSIFLCPIYNSRYNESMMALNSQFKTPDCYGTADFTAIPPVLKFKFPLNESALASCNNKFLVTDELGTGALSSYSKVQYVNISGSVSSEDPSKGMITYLPQIMYKFSCYYPMLYILNSTQLAVSGVDIAIRDNNGSFMSTLTMALYQDPSYKLKLTVPQSGLELKTKIYVEVRATNLTDKFHVVLDRCYATPSRDPSSSNFYNLLIGCPTDRQTVLELNGKDQKAQFHLEAFRFVEHKNKTVSTFYLHCFVRLCEVSTCSTIVPVCTNGPTAGRRRREAPDEYGNATVTSSLIVVKDRSVDPTEALSATNGVQTENHYSSPIVAVIVCIVILTILLAGMAAYFAFYIRR